MNHQPSFTKLAAGTLAALTCSTAGVLATSSPGGEAKCGKGGWGPAIGLGIAAGVIGGAAYAASGPGYYVAPPFGFTSCRYVERYERLG